jgi:hypothetical protein
VFTARYALSPYIKQIRFVFKGLAGFMCGGGGLVEDSGRRGCVALLVFPDFA